MKTNKLAALLARSAGLWPGCAARLLPLVLLLTLPAVVQAQFNYTTSNGAITITGYTGPGGAVTIPSTINGLPVTSIGSSAFARCTSLTSVTIPNSVTSMGYSAFGNCSGLSSVTIGNSVTSIPGGESHGALLGAFSFCTSLTNVTIGNSVTNIGEAAFYGCTSLSSVTIPNSVTYIGYIGVFWLHEPDQRYDRQQRHQHRGLCVLLLHQPDEHHDPQQRH